MAIIWPSLQKMLVVGGTRGYRFDKLFRSYVCLVKAMGYTCVVQDSFFTVVPSAILWPQMQALSGTWLIHSGEWNNLFGHTSRFISFAGYAFFFIVVRRG